MLVSMQVRAFWAIAAVAGTLAAQEPPQDQGKTFLVEMGTRIPLSMVNSVSTKTTGEGDRVYLETTFPIAVNGKIVIPAGSYVLGTVTSSMRPGKLKGRGEFRLRFDSLMLPNGVTRDFRAQVAGLDGRATRRAARLGVEGEEGHAFVGEPVEIRSRHAPALTAAVGPEIAIADVVAHDEENVGLGRCEGKARGGGDQPCDKQCCG